MLFCKNAQNYGAAGTSALLMKAIDVADHSKMYDIVQTKEANYKKMELAKGGIFVSFRLSSR